MSKNSVKQRQSDSLRESEKNKTNSDSTNKLIENKESVNKVKKERNDRKVEKIGIKSRLKEELKRKKLRKTVERETQRITKIIVPISLCMLIVVLSIHFFPIYSNGIEDEAKGVFSFYESKGSSKGTKALSAILTVALFFILLVVITFCMALVIIYEFDRFIKGFFIFSFIMYFGFFGTVYMSIAVYEYNIAIDWITIVFIMWNYTGVGLVTFFIVGPKILKQIYLILLCSNMSLIMILVIPDWTAWLLLIVMGVWDCYAVLHETGPLNKMLNKLQNDKKPMPPIIYTTAIWLGTDTNDNTEEDLELELGLGDFIFFSLLVGKALVSGDFLVAIICYICILVGLAITLFILILKNIPLPALPISISFGVIAKFITAYTIIPFNDELNDKMIFI